jgi:hypothetical protein
MQNGDANCRVRDALQGSLLCAALGILAKRGRRVVVDASCVCSDVFTEQFGRLGWNVLHACGSAAAGSGRDWLQEQLGKSVE